MFQTTNQLWYPVIHIQLPSGKLTQLWKISIFNGKTHYKWAMFNSYVSHYQRVRLVIVQLAMLVYPKVIPTVIY